jgi:DNA-binding transcriptional regulator YhcF (GntR family)
MYVVVDPTSEQSAYEQIAHQIRIKIIGQELTEGARLIAMRKLAADLGVSYTTVVYAYRALAADGFIEITPRGAYVLARQEDDEPHLDKSLLHTFKRTLHRMWQAGASREWIYSQADHEIPNSRPSPKRKK